MPTSPSASESSPDAARGPDATPDATLAALSFEDALGELERIVRGLEGGQQKLEDAIGAYERGAALRRHCEAKLSEAEARVQAIVERADGALSTQKFD
jgi:exodeoxyribonuclease VII small subunit